MFRNGLIILSALLSGCTVAWLDLRTESKASPSWVCPTALNIFVTGGYTTNTFGAGQTAPDRALAKSNKYEELAGQYLHARGCRLNGSPDQVLVIRVEEMYQLSALPQEWLTGLSLGLIPSWGTRPAEVRFSFSQESRTAAYVVDHKTVNHLVLFPVFWITIFLTDEGKAFENALADFTLDPGLQGQKGDD